MRKLVLLGFLALTFSLFSSSAFSGNVDDCDFLKNKHLEDYTPGLYGICVAWHNASKNGDERALARLEQKYSDRSGGDPIPGSADDDKDGQDPFFECPCWNELTPEYMCGLGEPAFYSIEEFDDSNPELTDVYFGTALFYPFTAFNDSYQVTPDLDICRRIFGSEAPIEFSLTTAEGYICGYELGEIAKLTPSDLCNP